MENIWKIIYPCGSKCLLRKYLGYDLGGQVPSQTVFGSIGYMENMWKKNMWKKCGKCETRMV